MHDQHFGVLLKLLLVDYQLCLSRLYFVEMPSFSLVTFGHHIIVLLSLNIVY